MSDRSGPQLSEIVRKAFGLDQAGRPSNASDPAARADPILGRAVAQNMRRPTILHLSASPLDTTSLRVADEHAAIRDALEKTRYGREFHLDQRPSAKKADLVRYLLEAKPAIAHFSGHGNTDGIALQRSNGTYEMVENELLARAFGDPVFEPFLRVVVMNSCLSDAQAQTIVQHVDVVVGTRKKITDNQATAFATGFYTALGNGEDVAAAYRFAVLQAELESQPGDAHVLLVRDGERAEEIHPLRSGATEQRRTTDAVSPRPSGTVEKVGDKHWRWVGWLPGSVDDVYEAVEDVLRKLGGRGIAARGRDTLVARLGGLGLANFDATEEVVVVLGAAPSGGTDVTASSRTTGGLFDYGRNEANINTLVHLLGVQPR